MCDLNFFQALELCDHTINIFSNLLITVYAAASCHAIFVSLILRNV